MGMKLFKKPIDMMKKLEVLGKIFIKGNPDRLGDDSFFYEGNVFEKIFLDDATIYRSKVKDIKEINNNNNDHSQHDDDDDDDNNSQYQNINEAIENLKEIDKNYNKKNIARIESIKNNYNYVIFRSFEICTGKTNDQSLLSEKNIKIVEDNWKKYKLFYVDICGNFKKYTPIAVLANQVSCIDDAQCNFLISFLDQFVKWIYLVNEKVGNIDWKSDTSDTDVENFVCKRELKISKEMVQNLTNDQEIAQINKILKEINDFYGTTYRVMSPETQENLMIYFSALFWNYIEMSKKNKNFDIICNINMQLSMVLESLLKMKGALFERFWRIFLPLINGYLANLYDVNKNLYVDFVQRVYGIISQGGNDAPSVQRFLISLLPPLFSNQENANHIKSSDDDSDSSEEEASTEHSHSSSSTRSSNASLVSVQSSTQMTVFNPFAQPPREGNSSTFFQRVLPRLGGFEGDVKDISDLLSFNFDTLEGCSEIVLAILQEAFDALDRWKNKITDVESLYRALSKFNRAKNIFYMPFDSDKSNLAGEKANRYKASAQKSKEEKNRKIYNELRNQSFVILDNDAFKIFSLINTWLCQFKKKETKTGNINDYQKSLISYIKRITNPNDILPFIQKEENAKSILGRVATTYIVIRAINDNLSTIPEDQIGKLDVYAFGFLLQMILQDLEGISNKKALLIGEHISHPGLEIKKGRLTDDELEEYFSSLINFASEKMMEFLFDQKNVPNQEILLNAINDNNFVAVSGLSQSQDINMTQLSFCNKKIIPLDVLSTVNNFIFPETVPGTVVKVVKNGAKNVLAFFGK